MRVGVGGAIIDGRYRRGDVEVVDGRIASYGLSPRGHGLALPGLVDLQVNGYAGVDFSTASVEEYESALSSLRSHGVFAVQPTFITASEDDLAKAVRAAAAAQQRYRSCAILGVHIEGPFLSPNHRGIHRPEYLRQPDGQLLNRLRSCGPVRTITVAPELDGALGLISDAVASGLVVQLGHSAASAEQANEGFNRGARSVTHIFNGMRAFSHRDPGIVGAALARTDVIIQIIADRVHVADEAVQLVLNAARHRVVLVTDAISAAAAPDGRYTAGGNQVIVQKGVARLDDGTLAGSTAPLIQQIRNVIDFGWSTEAAVNMASRQPARLHGRSDLGTLCGGGPADMVIVDDAFQPVRILAAGTDVLP
ncbi:N-acetylglucosamine-6-phosphate deacetylase [Demequina lutea]|uniref:N-acetylglucosamine-6-phosphate deacetylase n=1 Tax=Demequina lutea TaxID=431489 RepID=UPI000A057200|nr:N-acetylglucosamine-6-phosphate deacetylase [Demequina lutea]